MKELIFDYLLDSKSIVLDGVVNFRIREYREILEYVAEMNPKRIVYVSCNPTSLARDLNLLKEKFEIKKCSIVDMFCQTVGVETVICLEAK